MQPLVFNIVRDEISRKSVPDAFLLKPGIGYIFLEQFNETTSHEMEESLKAMDEDNLKGLVLDLRGNPGGLLNEAVTWRITSCRRATSSFPTRAALPPSMFTPRATAITAATIRS